MDEKHMEMGERQGRMGGMDHDHDGHKCMLCHGFHCDKCGMGWHHEGMCPMCGGRHIILRWIIGIIILVAVFSMGVKLGELKSVMNYGYSNYGGRYMMSRDYQNPGIYYGPGMIGLWGNGTQSTSTK
jgi:RNA polymerase subunit RPABC4/transcription elongation factor Spt4